MQKIYSGLKNLDKVTYKIIKYGLLFSTSVGLIATTFLCSYIILGVTFFYYLGITLIKESFFLAVEFIVCGIIVDSIKKQT